MTDPKAENKSLSRQAKRIADKEIEQLYKRVGKRIGELREDASLSQRAACTGVFGNANLQSEWSRWERGIQLPNVQTLSRIAIFFGVSLGAIGLYEPQESISEMRLAQARELLAKLTELIGPP